MIRPVSIYYNINAETSFMADKTLAFIFWYWSRGFGEKQLDSFQANKETVKAFITENVMSKEKNKFKGKMYDEDCLPEESIDTHLNKLFDIIG